VVSPHAPVALPLGKEPPVPIGWKAGLAPLTVHKINFVVSEDFRYLSFNRIETKKRTLLCKFQPSIRLSLNLRK
jgi:hypothetical protein